MIVAQGYGAAGIGGLSETIVTENIDAVIDLTELDLSATLDSSIDLIGNIDTDDLDLTGKIETDIDLTGEINTSLDLSGTINICEIDEEE